MKSFRDYAKQESNATQSGAESTANIDELTRKIAAAYNGTSNADILRNILTEAEKSKRAGTLSNEEIEAFYQNFSPMLDSSQKKKLRIVVDKLKKI